jgi:hypothetical protein
MTHLQSLISSHQAKAQASARQLIDWSKRKQKWLTTLAQLTQQIRSDLLAAGVADQQIQTMRCPINEESLGAYETQGLAIQIGTSTVTFTPVGSIIIGGYGRVDVSGPRGDVKLIAVDAEPAYDLEDNAPAHTREWVWFVYPERGRSGSCKFDAEGLAKVLEMELGAA